MSESIRTDSILHFHEGVFGEEGYAVPNHGKRPGTLNSRIFKLTVLLGQNLFAMLHRRDVDLRVPPRVNFLMDMHDLYVRMQQLLEAYTIPHNQSQMEPVHVSPAGHIWKVWPVPFYNVRNDMIRDWAAMIMYGISELFQHSENATEMDFGPRLRSVIDPYLKRVYQEMAIQCFGKTQQQVLADGFFLTQADFDGYNPDIFFTGTERVDTVPNLGRVMTEDMLSPLREGLLVTALPTDLRPFPGTLHGYYDTFGADLQSALDAEGALVDSSLKSSTAQGSASRTAMQGTASGGTSGRQIMQPTL